MKDMIHATKLGDELQVKACWKLMNQGMQDLVWLSVYADCKLEFWRSIRDNLKAVTYEYIRYIKKEKFAPYEKQVNELVRHDEQHHIVDTIIKKSWGMIPCSEYDHDKIDISDIIRDQLYVMAYAHILDKASEGTHTHPIMIWKKLGLLSFKLNRQLYMFGKEGKFLGKIPL